MNFSIPRAFGWILIFLGLAVIFYSLFFSYHIFNSDRQPPMIFKELPPTAVEKSQLAANGKKETDLFNLIGQELGNKINSGLGFVFPQEYLLKILNLASWSMFASILFFAGGQIAGLGIKLVKN